MIDAMNLRVSRALLALVAFLVAVAFGTPLRADEETGEAWQIGTDAPVAEEPAVDPAPERFAPKEPAAAADREYADGDPSALTDFRQDLDPYGRWVDHPRYGTVWVPNPEAVGPSFAPYVTSGHWALHEDGGWIWVSDYPFGWVVFHYGRWVWTQDYGWVWIPGRRYAHAWVVWRVPVDGYAYVGWAPMPPDYVWYGGVAVTFTYGAYYPWVFCPSTYVFSHHVHRYIVHDHYRVRSIARHTRVHRPARGRHPSYRGPAPRVARVPAHAVPKGRIPADPRAVAASRRGSSERRLSGPTPAGRSLSTRSVGRWRAPPRRPRLTSPKTLANRGVVTRPPRTTARRSRSARPSSWPPAARPARVRPRPVPVRAGEVSAPHGTSRVKRSARTPSWSSTHHRVPPRVSAPPRSTRRPSAFSVGTSRTQVTTNPAYKRKSSSPAMRRSPRHGPVRRARIRR